MDDCWKILENFHKAEAERHDLKLNKEQRFVFDLVKTGASVFVTGPSGTGKSLCIVRIIEWAKLQGKQIGTTATTGASAILIGGQTIQSFMGIGSGDKSVTYMVKSILSNPRQLALLQLLELLIIDEISMLDDVLFDKISQVLSIVRTDDKPFGGVQLVLCGDFFQNCPIGGRYCFLSDVWNDSSLRTVIMKTFMRHRDDVEFQKILQSLRFGNVTRPVLDRLERLKYTEFEKGIEPTVLYSRNVDADVVNTRRYEALVAKGARPVLFEVTTCGSGSKAWATSCKVPDKIHLCEGAQVMVTWNVSIAEGIINGTRGVIVGFSPFPVIRIHHSSEHKQVMIKPHTIKDENAPNNSMTFMPLKLAWALTIAKSQGCTLDHCIIDLASRAFGQAYTALSRARSLKHIKLIGDIKAEFFKASPDVIAFYEQCVETTARPGTWGETVYDVEV